MESTSFVCFLKKIKPLSWPEELVVCFARVCPLRVSLGRTASHGSWRLCAWMTVLNFQFLSCAVNQNLYLTSLAPNNKKVFFSSNTFPHDSFLIWKRIQLIHSFCVVQMLRLNNIGRLDVVQHLVTHCTLTSHT